MKLLIAYDVATGDKAGRRRLRRVARACQDFGIRVQKSLFECSLGPVDWAQLRHRLLDEIDANEDSLRIYYLDGDTKIEHFGTNTPPDLDGDLVV